MDKKTFTIGVLSLSALILFVANLLVPPRAMADQVVKERDFQVVTAHIQQNDEGLYILDNRSGQMAVFVYDPNAHTVVPKAIGPVMQAFAGMGGGARR